MAQRTWLDLINDMLWIVDRETKFTLRGINDEFRHIGLSFDPDFRFQFLDIIVKRIARTYDQFMINLETEALRTNRFGNTIDTGTFSGTTSNNSSNASNGQKRRTPDNGNSDEKHDTDNNEPNSPNDGNGTSVVKRRRMDTAVPAENNNFDQNHDGSDDENGAAIQQNGKRSINSGEIFQRGIVVAIPIEQIERLETDASESVSSVGIYQAPTATTSVIKREPEMDINLTSDGCESPSEIGPSTLSLPRQSSQIEPTTATRLAETNRQNAVLSSSQECRSDYLPARRLTRSASRGLAIKSNSTPSKPTSVKLVPTTTSDNTTAANEAIQARTSEQIVKKLRRKSIATRTAERESFKCKHCDYTTAWKCSFVRHLLIHNDPTVDLTHLQCGKCAHLKPKRRSSILKENTTSNLDFECDLCTRKFAAEDLLEMHHVTVHRHQCPKCKKKFVNEQQIGEHEKRCKYT